MPCTVTNTCSHGGVESGPKKARSDFTPDAAVGDKAENQANAVADGRCNEEEQACDFFATSAARLGPVTIGLPLGYVGQSGPAWLRTPLLIDTFSPSGYHRGMPTTGRFSLEQALVVDLAAVNEDVRVRVGRDRKLSLTDEAADLRPAPARSFTSAASAVSSRSARSSAPAPLTSSASTAVAAGSTGSPASIIRPSLRLDGSPFRGSRVRRWVSVSPR